MAVTKAALATKLSKAFVKLGEIVQTLTVYDRKNGVYDPTTGVVGASEVIYATKGVVMEYTTLEVAQSQGTIDNSDLKVIILASDITVAPKTNFIIGYAGAEYRVVDVTKDALSLTYTLQAR